VRIGQKREQNYNIPVEKKNDKKFLDENLDKVGHSPDVFRYIEDGYSILNALK
jgi:hypothetical protein